MKTSNKDLMNNSTKKKLDGVDFHEVSLYEEAGLMIETALEFGLDTHEVKRFKKQIERS